MVQPDLELVMEDVRNLTYFVFNLEPTPEIEVEYD